MNQQRSDLANAIDVLASQGWFSQRSKATRARLSAIAKLRRFAKDEMIYLAGDRPNGVFGLVWGSLNISFPRSDGEDYTLHRPVQDSGLAIWRCYPALCVLSQFVPQSPHSWCIFPFALLRNCS